MAVRSYPGKNGSTEQLRPVPFITERIGWDTFRRSLATLLIDVGAPVKLKQEIMRHANSRVTLELYQQVSMTAEKELQARVVSVW